MKEECSGPTLGTTLQYIKNESKRFHTYVANRIAEIHEITSPEQWRHCPGKLNPANEASRGLKPQELTDQYCWWKGPEYLWESEENRPEAEFGEVPQSDPEVRDKVQVHSIKIENPDTGLDSEVPCASNQPVYKMMNHYSLWFKATTLHCLASTLLPLAKEPENPFEYKGINHRGTMRSNPAYHEVSLGSKFC